MEMSGNHRASQDTISIIRTAILNKKDEVRRPKSNLFRNNKLRFPVLRSVSRASSKRYRTVFKANRPNTFKQ
jgi:large subunit ribosomal protein L18Ae